MLRAIEYLLYLFIFLIPWNARWVIRAGELHGGFWEYGTIALYATDVIFFVILVLWGVWWLKRGLQISDLGFKKITRYWLLVTGYSLISIFWSFDKPVAFYAALKLLQGIALFFLIRTLPIDRTKFIWAFVASAVVQSMLAIAQFFTQSVFAWPWSGIAPQDPSDLGVSVVQFGEERWLRAYGSFPHPNLLGAFLAIALIIISPFIPRILSEKRGSYWLLVTGYSLLVTGLFFTFSRTAWLATIVGMMYWCIVTSAWRERIIRQTVLLVTGYALLVTIIFFPLVRTRLGGGERLEIQSNRERTVGYREAVQLIKTHPFVGVGIGNYTAAIARELRLNNPSWSYQPVHNVPFLILAELGLIGFILLFLFFWRCVFNFPLPSGWHGDAAEARAWAPRREGRDKAFHGESSRTASWVPAAGSEHEAARRDRSPRRHITTLLIALAILALLDHSFWTLHSGILLLWFALAMDTP